MAFIRIKTIKGVKYYYLVESKREEGKVRQKILQYFGTTLPDVYSVIRRGIVPTKETRSERPGKASKKVGPTKRMGEVKAKPVSTTPTPEVKRVVPTGKGHIYYLGYSVPGPGSFERKILKNFGTTLPSDEDIVAAVGTTPGCYLVESVRGKEKILKSDADIAALVGTTKPEEGGYTQEELDALGDKVTDIVGKVFKGRR